MSQGEASWAAQAGLRMTLPQSSHIFQGSFLGFASPEVLFCQGVQS